MRYTTLLFSTIIAFVFLSIPAVAKKPHNSMDTAVSSEEVFLSETQQHLTIMKDLDSKTLYGLDESGNTVDAEALIQAETEAVQKKYGKLEPDLWKMLQAEAAEESFLVHVFLYSTPALEGAVQAEREIRLNSTDMEESALQSSLEAARAEKLAISEQIIVPVSEAVSSVGGEIESEFTATHSLTAWMTAAQIQALQTRPDVMRICRNDKVGEPEQDVAWRTLGTGGFWPRGIQGNNIPVAIVEGDGVRTDRPYIDLKAVRDGGCPGDHATFVAHNIAADTDHWRGIAPFADIYSANDCSWTYSGLQNAMQWALVNYNPQVYNHSWGNSDSPGTIDSMDQFLDQFSYTNAEIQIKSAGNIGGTCYSPGYYVSHPGLGFNTLTVGALDDKNTIPRSGDTVATFSCYGDPTGRNKPEVAAPGVNLRVKLLGPPKSSPPVVLSQGSGTSYAAPQVAGLAALIENAGKVASSSEPYVHKAFIMATAIYDVEAGSTNRDGVGGVSAAKFNQLYDNYSANFWRSYTITSTTNISVNLQSGTSYPKMRAVLVWEENPSGEHRAGMPYPTYPQADWDLIIKRPDNSTAGSSSSARNTYEMVEFTVNQTGTWTFQVLDFSSPAGVSSSLAVVWVPIP
jgi:serine protease AprX